MRPVSRRPRAGFTLAELLVALVLFSILGAAMLKVLTSQQRSYNAQLSRTGMQQSIRVAAAILPGEFRELDAGDGDIVAMSDTSITVHSYRQFGIVCSPPTLGGVVTGVAISLRGPLFSSSRDFVVGDSLYVWYEGDGTIRTDDGWVPGRIVTVSSGNCPTLPNAGSDVKLNVALAMGGALVNAAGNIPNGAPVRGFETRIYRLYQAPDGKWYLGIKRGGTTDQLIGPLTGSTGLTFTYRDAAGAVTATRTSVARIDVTLRAVTKNPIYNSQGTLSTVSDSVVMSVALRNNPRF